MNLPKLFENCMSSMLCNEYEYFKAALSMEAPISVRLNFQKIKQGVIPNEERNLQQNDHLKCPPLEPVPWSPSGFYLAKRPLFTMDPLFHAGGYYVQEASSMFLEQAVKQHLCTENPLVLDLCAAPGGKSTHLTALLNNGLLVSNEIIRSRMWVLAENLTKWGAPNVVVTNNDPKDFAFFNGLFDMIVIDAPCSGEGMFRKDPHAICEWTIDNVHLCRDRQKRIVADVFPALKTGGLLIYCTCTYNRDENEDNVKWIAEQLGAEPLSINIDNSWNVVASEWGYRFFPHKIKGEGFFLSILVKTQKEGNVRKKIFRNKRDNGRKFTSQMPAFPKEWICDGDFQYIEEKEKISVVPSLFSDVIMELKKKLKIVQAGVSIGTRKGKEILPDTALALSWIINKTAFQTKEVSWEEAIAFLGKNNLHFPETNTGWLLLQFQGFALGWVKNLGNRANNTYPQEWRIRMKATDLHYFPFLHFTQVP